LALLVLAVVGMVAVAFSVPLAFAVRVVAEDRALSAAEQEIRTLSGVLAAFTDPADSSGVVTELDAGSERAVAVVLPDGERVGADIDIPDEQLTLARRGRAFTTEVDGGLRLLAPVRYADGAVAVAAVEVPEDLVHRGVPQAWAILAAVAVLLVLLGVALADRLARSVVKALDHLGTVTERLRHGDLGARTAISGPGELAAVGATVNALADRIGELLDGERQAAADRSHRLRTPLTALKLEADAVSDGEERARITDAVDQLGAEVDALIREARSRPPGPTGPAPATTDLAEVARQRLAFWAVLADDQGRPWSFSGPDGGPVPVPVPVPADERSLTDSLDALLHNVFGHTPEGTGFRVEVAARNGAGARLVVEDDGPGIGLDGAAERGASGAGSTGLGLDIVRRTAEASGGSLDVGCSEAGGARVVVSFGPAPDGG
jgi:signal transduction histidine kinase